MEFPFGRFFNDCNKSQSKCLGMSYLFPFNAYSLTDSNADLFLRKLKVSQQNDYKIGSWVFVQLPIL